MDKGYYLILAQLFPVDWFIVYDRLGNDCKVDIPIHLKGKLKWTPTLYDFSNGTLALGQKLFGINKMLIISLL